MADPIMMPSGQGGLMRYNEEYPSKLKFSATSVIVIIAIVVFTMIAIKIIFQ